MSAIIDGSVGSQFPTTIGVGNATPSTSGAGITFPATASASSNANTLDDYEEGSWTPTIAFGGASVGVIYDTQKGNYTKIGNRVFISMYLALTNKGSSTGVLSIVGLPFPSINTSSLYNNMAVWMNNASSISGSLQGYNSFNSSSIDAISFLNTGAFTNITDSNINNNTDFMINFSYSIG